MAHYYHYILRHIYFISSLHLHICCALHFFTIWNNQPSCGLVLTIFKPWSTPHHLPTFIYLSRILIAPQSLLGGSQPSLVQSLAWILLTLLTFSLMITALSFNHPASPYQLWLPSSSSSYISYAIAHKRCHAGLVPMLAPGGWWWVLVATSGSCGRWVLVGVMQIPDTGHGPHATRRLQPALHGN